MPKEVATLRVLYGRSVCFCPGGWPEGSDTLLGPRCGRRGRRQAARYSQPCEFFRLCLPLRARPVATLRRTVPDALAPIAILAAGQRHCAYADKLIPTSKDTTPSEITLFIFGSSSPVFSLWSRCLANQRYLFYPLSWAARMTSVKGRPREFEWLRPHSQAPNRLGFGRMLCLWPISFSLP